MAGSELRSFIIGGDRLVRECLRQLLGERLDIIGEADGAADFLDHPPAEMPHVLLFLETPRAPETLPEALRSIRRKWLLTRIVVLTSGEMCARAAAELLEAGADGLLSLDMEVEALVHAVRVVIFGGRICSAPLLAGAPEPQSLGGGDRVSLTARQAEILAGLSDGRTNKEIARQLGISEATVKVQVRSLLRKIGATNRTQAAVWARENAATAAAAE